MFLGVLALWCAASAQCRQCVHIKSFLIWRDNARELTKTLGEQSSLWYQVKLVKKTNKCINISYYSPQWLFLHKGKSDLLINSTTNCFIQVLMGGYEYSLSLLWSLDEIIVKAESSIKWVWNIATCEKTYKPSKCSKSTEQISKHSHVTARNSFSFSTCSLKILQLVNGRN